MKPVTREEQYLNRLTGEEQEIPEEPVTREEQYLARLCGQTNSIPEKPVTRREEYLANLCGEDVIIPEEQVTRMEQYMAFAAGARETKPEEPVTREEMYWDKYQGGDVPEEKTIAFTDIITVTDALARPAVDLQSEITATQNLNGYEYPWVGGAGKNLVDIPTLNITTNTDLTIPIGDKITLDAGTYTFSWTLKDTVTATRNRPLYILNGVYNYASTDYKTSGRGSWTFTLTESAEIQLAWWQHTVSIATTVSDFQLEIGSTATAYAPYENLCPISGRTEVNVTRTGKNITSLTTFSPTPRPYWGTNWTDLVAFINTLPVGSYAISLKFKTVEVIYESIRVGLPYIRANVNGTYVNLTPYNVITDNAPEVGKEYEEATTFTITSETKGKITECYLYANGANYEIEEFQIELGSTATEYEPYEGDTFNTELGRTVYGGTLDLITGELTLTHAYVDLGDLTWTLLNTNLFRTTLYTKKDGYTNFTTTCYRTVNKTFTELQNGETASITLEEHGHPLRLIHVKDERATTAEEFTTLVTGQKMVYELATPQTISLTPTEVQMLENNNTIWADSGRVQLTYLSKAAQRVQTMNASLQANALKLSGLKKTTEEGGTTK